MNPAIQTENLTFALNRPVLGACPVRREGQIIGIWSQRIGKTTLLKIFGGLERAGNVRSMAKYQGYGKRELSRVLPWSRKRQILFLHGGQIVLMGRASYPAL
jgi:hypothetical protein